MSAFQDATHVAITGGTLVAAAPGSTVNIHHGGQREASSALKDLSAAAAFRALHDSSARFNAPRCHRNTRSTYLDALERWMLGVGEEYAHARLIWLNGGAGVGKSAVMQSIVERCAQYVVVLGTFFFSRADPSRNFAEVLIPTLAYQLACVFPEAMAVLEPTIQRNPLIFKASLQTQAYELLVRPLLYLTEHGVIDTTAPLRRVFVIDGLDECDNPTKEKQALIIHVVATILCDHRVPICFLIASRPEMTISTALQRETRVHSVLASITLDNNAEACSDIRRYVEDSFHDIINNHPLRSHIPPDWPHSNSVDLLVYKSSGHFIYPATAMKFILSTDEHPARALQVVEGLVPSRTGNPFAELDALYLHILTAAKYSHQVLSILRHCFLTEMGGFIKAICLMNADFTPEDISLFLSDVQALVSLSWIIKSRDPAGIYIVPRHASLIDFLKDMKRSQTIHMSSEEYKASLLPRYFWLLDNGIPTATFPMYYVVTHDLVGAIEYSQDIELLQSLIQVHSAWDVWHLCMLEHYLVPAPTGNYVDYSFTLATVSRYIRAIRDSAANYDNTLYINQFKTFIQVLLDHLNNPAQVMEPKYQRIPALIFSSSMSCLARVAPFLVSYYSLPSGGSNAYGYRDIFMDLQLKKSSFQFEGVIDPRSYEAIKCLPQGQLFWGSDLAIALTHLLQELLGDSWTPECLSPSRHEQWLHQTKPSKHTSQGSPRLSSNFYSYIRRLPKPDGKFSWSYNRARRLLDRHQFTYSCAEKIWMRRERCFFILKAVIHYLHKCSCTGDLAKLARKSLPKGALWFPRLMKRARAKMDAYVMRWEESLEGLLEKTKSFSIDKMD